MTDDFDFDFDVNRGRSGSRTQDREAEEATDTGNGREPTDPKNGNGDRNGGNGGGRLGELDFGFGDFENPEEPEEPEGGDGAEEPERPRGGNGGYAARAKRLLSRKPEPVYGDRVEAEDERADAQENGGEGEPARPLFGGEPAGGSPSEARSFAKEARRRASRRPSPILDMDVERERLEREPEADQDGDFESILERQPQKGGVARRGSAISGAFRGGVRNLRKIGGERIADSKDRVQALREKVPTRIPQPQAAGGDGKPPPPRLPRRSRRAAPASPSPAGSSGSGS